MENMYKKALFTKASINAKLNIQKINFYSVTRLVESITYPAGTYGFEVYANNIDVDTYNSHLDCIYGAFRKNWCGVSKFTRNLNLLNDLYGIDEWGLHRVKPGTQKFHAIYYSNGFNHKICETDRSYALRSIEVCRCALCQEQISSNEHILHCRWFDYAENPIRRFIRLYELD